MSTEKTAQTTDRVDAADLLDTLSDAQVTTFRRYLKPEDFHSGDCILAQGDADRSVYIISAGRLDLIIDLEDGTPPAIVGALQAGDVVGEIAFFDGLPRTASIVARTDGQVLILTREGFDRLRHDDPVLALDLVCDMARVIAQHFRYALGRRRAPTA